MKLIDKYALVAEIEKRIKNLYPKGGQGMVVTKILKDHYEDLLSFIDTLPSEEEPALTGEEQTEIDFEQELYKAFGQVKDFTLGMRIAKWFYDIGKNSQEPISEDLEEVADQYSQGIESDYTNDMFDRGDIYEAVIYGAKWQKQQDQSTIELAEDHAMFAGMEKMREQMMEKAVDATIGLPYENKDGGYTHIVDVSRPLPVGDNKIAIIFKED